VIIKMLFTGHGPHCEPAGDPPEKDGPQLPDDSLHPPGPRPPTPQALEMLRHAIIGKTMILFRHSPSHLYLC
jgi:hypothetical protein